MIVRGSTTERARERAALVTFTRRATRAGDPDILLDELTGLARAAGADVAWAVGQVRDEADSATLIGRGKAESLAQACAEVDADLVIVDHELTAAQTRNLEAIVGRRVIDRTTLILDIFARRARTRDGQLQVELAQLEYRLPRLAGSRAALSRLGGGIGTRGPGETKLETDRRRIRDRIAALTREIAGVGRRRSFLRRRRRRADVPVVALVGYTNAGKTTLFNRLTGARAVASDALFVTLDPLMRRVRLPDARQIVLTDTVGFIDRLPHQLVAAFHATLEEVSAADLLIHVIDAAAPDRERRRSAVHTVLAEVGAAEVPVLEVRNKVDAMAPDDLARYRAADPDALWISATRETGIEDVLAAVTARLGMDATRVHFDLSGSSDRARRLVADLYRYGRVLSHVATPAGASVDAEVPRRLLARLPPSGAVS